MWKCVSYITVPRKAFQSSSVSPCRHSGIQAFKATLVVTRKARVQSLRFAQTGKSCTHHSIQLHRKVLGSPARLSCKGSLEPSFLGCRPDGGRMWCVYHSQLHGANGKSHPVPAPLASSAQVVGSTSSSPHGLCANQKTSCLSHIIHSTWHEMAEQKQDQLSGNAFTKGIQRAHMTVPGPQ